MIIWLNGAFGAGKTQTAYELHHRIPNSHIYDPEQFGFFIRKNLPKQLLQGDFQHYSIWREGNYATLKYLAQHYNGVIIVPMTIVNPDYYIEIIQKLKDDGYHIHHFVLWAEKETLCKRLRSRGEKKNSWAEQQIERCLTGLSQNIFENKLATDTLRIEEVAETIASKLHIELQSDPRSSFKKRMDRFLMKLSRI